MCYTKTMSENIAEAVRELTQKPMLATTAERFLILDQIKSKYKELPQPLRFSKCLSILLRQVSVPLETYDLIAGRTVDRLLTSEEEQHFAEFQSSPDFPRNSIFFDSGHCTYSWETVVREGLSGLKLRAHRSLNEAVSEDKKIFFTAILEIYDAIEQYMLRYARAAEKVGMQELAKNLRQAADVPTSFASALQLLWTVALIDCAYITPNPTLTLGRLDQILYPLYQADIKSGHLTRERACEYITDYYCKHNLIMGRGEHQVGDESNSTTFARICCFDAPQYLLLAGTDKDGNCAANELTELFAQCIQPQFKNPVVVVRYVKDMDKSHPALWKILTDKALSSSSMMFYNDDRVIKTLQRIGLPPDDSKKYEHFGCNWCSAGPDSSWVNIGPKSSKYGVYTSEEERNLLDIPYMRMNTDCGWPEDFMIVLRQLAEKAPDSASIDDLYRLFFDRMADFAERKLAHVSRELAVRRRRPSAVITFGDCFLDCSLNTGECATTSAKYHFELHSFYMFGTVADCFIAVDQLIMRKKRLTLSRLLEAVDANFHGFEDVLAMCRHADKYGMDTPLSNAHAKRLSEESARIAIEKSKPYFEAQKLFLIPCIQSDTWHLKNGERFGATPDGRLASVPFSQNIRPSNSACVNGLGAMLNSVRELCYDGLVAGALNLDIDSKDFEGEEGAKIFRGLLAAYFNRGGLHAQISVASKEKLMEAQKRPDEYRDLRVRVTGYSGIFTDMCERLQNDIIARFDK